MDVKHHSVAMPTRSICDPKFVYVSAAKTDISKTFKKARLILALKKVSA